MPFGDDSNDLPIALMQKEMNRSLYTLLQEGSQVPPSFVYRKSLHQHKRTSQAQSMNNIPSSRGLSGTWPVSTVDEEPRYSAKLSLVVPPDEAAEAACLSREAADSELSDFDVVQHGSEDVPPLPPDPITLAFIEDAIRTQLWESLPDDLVRGSARDP